MVKHLAIYEAIYHAPENASDQKFDFIAFIPDICEVFYQNGAHVEFFRK